jgi:peptidyl-prolyl isomerase E (cyclophilin E)
LDENVTEELIRAAFIPFGDILTVHIPTDGHSGRTRGFAFIEYEEPEDAAAAQDNMHNAEFYGKVITCTIAKAQATKGRPSNYEDKMHEDTNSCL